MWPVVEAILRQRFQDPDEYRIFGFTPALKEFSVAHGFTPT
jgi:hypothetical protein